MQKLKVALVHDYIKEYGGAERVLESLHEIFPDAPIYTSVYLPSFLGPHQDRFKKMNIKTSLLQYIPFKSKLISPFRIISPLVFKMMNFDKFDVVIVSSTGAYMPNNITKGKAKLICYCHTPARYLYGFETARKVNNKFLKAGMHVVFHFLRIFDFYASQNVDMFIANSEEVKKRIWKYYKKDAIVINPPVATKLQETNYKKQTREYYVAGGRLARAKHPELAIKAAIELGFDLKVFGKSFAGYEQELKRIAHPNRSSLERSGVEFLGEVTEDKKWDLLSHAKAYISPSRDEDFGLLNVEALSVGTPVIAHASGGALETIVDNKTGVLFKKLNQKSVVDAIKKFEKLNIKAIDCKKQAEKFSEEIFKTKIRSIILA